jgi:hypothetical protein
VLDLHHLRQIAECEFPDLVRSTVILRDKLRVLLVDDSYIDFGRVRSQVGSPITGNERTWTGLFIAMTTCPTHVGKGSQLFLSTSTMERSMR